MQRPRPTYELAYGAQPQVATESDLWRIDLSGRTDSASCDGSYRFDFVGINKQTQARSEFVLCNETRQIDEVDVVGPARLLVLGRLGANFEVANVIELPSGEVVDHFMCFRPSVSPGNQFLAFVKIFPGHPGPVNVSNEYLVYDLSRSPSYNRGPGGPTASEAGWPVYPQGAMNTPGSNIIPQDAPFHMETSREFFWISPDSFAFADSFQGRNTLVVVDLVAGIHNARLRTLELEPWQFVDLPGCEGSFSTEDFVQLSQDPAGLIRIEDAELAGTDELHLRLAASPCLKLTEITVRLPGPR